MSVSVSVYIAHYRKLPLMRSVHRVLLKQMRLKWATDAEIWIAPIVAECVPDGRTNHGEQQEPAVFCPPHGPPEQRFDPGSNTLGIMRRDSDVSIAFRRIRGTGPAPR